MQLSASKLAVIVKHGQPSFIPLVTRNCTVFSNLRVEYINTQIFINKISVLLNRSVGNYILLPSASLCTRMLFYYVYFMRVFLFQLLVFLFVLTLHLGPVSVELAVKIKT